MTDRELLEIIVEKVGSLDKKVDGLDKKVDALDNKVDGLDNKVDGLDQKVGSLDSRLGSLEDKVDRIDYSVIKIEKEHGEKLTALFDGYKQNSDKLNHIQKEVSRQEEIILRKVK